MTPNPDESFLPKELIDEYLRIRQTDLAASKVFYFDKIMPALRPQLEARPVHLEYRGRYETLVSLMGFSPETTVISAVILRPRRLIIAYSEEAGDAAEPAIAYLTREGIVRSLSIIPVPVNAFNPADVYEKIRAKLPAHNKDMVFDITGGTKVMSSAAGALAWEKNLTLCYLNGVWDPKSGSAGLRNASVFTLLTNPSRSRGEETRRAALASYARGNFTAAVDGFAASQQLIHDNPLFDILGHHLSQCYSRLADFDRVGLADKLTALRHTVNMGGVRTMCQGRIDFDPHLSALQRFAAGDPATVAAGFLELAALYAGQDRHDFAGLLAYRAMEALVELGLTRIAPAFHMTKPDLSLLGDEPALRAAYSKLAPGEGAEVPPRITLMSGFGLLCLVSDVGRRFSTQGENAQAVRRVMTLGHIRNRSYLAHGVEQLSQKDSSELRAGAEKLAEAVLADDFAEFKVLGDQLRPVRLELLHAE